MRKLREGYLPEFGSMEANGILAIQTLILVKNWPGGNDEKEKANNEKEKANNAALKGKTEKEEIGSSNEALLIGNGRDRM